MMTAHDRPFETVAEKISNLLNQGIELDTEVLGYIDSTFSNPSWSELQQILADASDCELDSLLELIFFPSEGMQIQLEKCLEQCGLIKQDEMRVIAYIQENNPSVELFAATHKKGITIHSPPWAITQLVRRLNIDKRQPPRVIEAIDQFIPLHLQDRLKVCLRNKQKPLSENHLLLLCEFIEKSASGKTGFWGVFQFLVGLFDEIGDDVDLFAALAESKRACIESLQSVAKLEAQFEKSNMETMLMQGIRIPYIDKQAARQKLEMIDHICYTVFGKIADVGELNFL
jgi:hypothetical protein